MRAWPRQAHASGEEATADHDIGRGHAESMSGARRRAACQNRAIATAACSPGDAARRPGAKVEDDGFNRVDVDEVMSTENSWRPPGA